MNLHSILARIKEEDKLRQQQEDQRPKKEIEWPEIKGYFPTLNEIVATIEAVHKAGY